MRLAVQEDTVAENLQVLFLVHATLIGDSDKVDSADATRSHRKGGPADTVDEGVELLGVGKEPAAV